MVSGSVKRILGNSSTVLHLFIIVLQYYEYDFALFQYIDYDFALYLFIFAIILFLVYHSYMLGLGRLELYTCLGSYSVYPSHQWVNDKYCVGVVPIPYLFAIVPYMRIVG